MNGRSKAKVESVTMKKTANNGFIVSHHYDNSMSGPSYMPSQDHAFGSHKEAMAHVHKVMGGKAPGAISRPPSHRAGMAAATKRGAGVD